jgi:hypothetical protein
MWFGDGLKGERDAIPKSPSSVGFGDRGVKCPVKNYIDERKVARWREGSAKVKTKNAWA